MSESERDVRIGEIERRLDALTRAVAQGLLPVHGRPTARRGPELAELIRAYLDDEPGLRVSHAI